MSGDRARAALLRLAQASGRSSVPDVAVVDSPAGLLELLREHQRAEWIPAATGPGAPCAGEPARRLSEARLRLSQRTAQARPA